MTGLTGGTKREIFIFKSRQEYYQSTRRFVCSKLYISTGDTYAKAVISAQTDVDFTITCKSTILLVTKKLSNIEQTFHLQT